MPLSPLYGHAATRFRLATSWRAGSLPASLLLQGQRGVGKQRLGLWLGQLILCERAAERAELEPCGECTNCRYSLRGQHPDLHWFFPRPRLKEADPDVEAIKQDYAEAIVERMLSDGLWSSSSGSDGIHIPTVRALVQLASLRPAMARHRVFVVADAERMVPQTSSPDAANAFLKLLEEPPTDTTVILTSSEPGALLPTIRSRVVTVRVPAVAAADVAEFFDHPAVAKQLKGVARAEAIAMAAGAPGALLDRDSTATSYKAARQILDAALGPSGPQGTADRARVSARHGAAGARGSYSDSLDALTLLLHDRARALAAAGSNRLARRAAQAVIAVAKTKEKAQGNVSPSLLTAALIATLHTLLTA